MIQIFSVKYFKSKANIIVTCGSSKFWSHPHKWFKHLGNCHCDDCIELQQLANNSLTRNIPFEGCGWSWKGPGVVLEGGKECLLLLWLLGGLLWSLGLLWFGCSFLWHLGFLRFHDLLGVFTFLGLSAFLFGLSAFFCKISNCWGTRMD